MAETTLCPYCGAYSRRSCEYEEMTGMPRSCAPCEEDDDWDAPDPDMAREDRDERRALQKAEGRHG